MEGHESRPALFGLAGRYGTGPVGSVAELRVAWSPGLGGRARGWITGRIDGSPPGLTQRNRSQLSPSLDHLVAISRGTALRRDSSRLRVHRLRLCRVHATFQSGIDAAFLFR